MKHIFQRGSDSAANTLLLLHGTGGNEHDLLPLAKVIDENANVLSVRGNVLENGMPRFFRRIAEGIFDEEDLVLRTAELHQFVDEQAKTYQFDRNKVIAIGYSNGANIAASLLFHHPHALAHAILLHPMVPRRGVQLPDLQGTSVFIGAGTNDPICPQAETTELSHLLQGANASVELYWDHQGHRISAKEIEQATHWYQSL